MAVTTGAQQPLDRFPLLRTRDPIEAQHVLQSCFQVRKFHVSGNSDDFDATINYAQLHQIGLVYCRYGTGVEIELPPDDIIRLHFGIDGSGEVTVGARRIAISAGKACLTPAFAGLSGSFDSRFTQLIIRFSESLLRKRLGTMLGRPIEAPLQFDLSTDLSDPHVALLKQFAFSIAADGETVLPMTNPLVVAEISDVAMTTLLHGVPHNLSALLSAGPTTISPWQVRRAIDFIEANWAKPLSVDDIARAVGASSRSIFMTFRKATGFSPMMYVKMVRLKRAREMLTDADGNTTVIGVALTAGFQNAGHFAKSYRDMFGELPSETLARAKR